MYEYQEYPKWVKSTDGKDIVVNNKAEEAEVAEGHAEDAGTGEVQRDDRTERERLEDRAKELGVEAKPQWGVARLRAAVEDAEPK